MIRIMRASKTRRQIKKQIKSLYPLLKTGFYHFDLRNHSFFTKNGLAELKHNNIPVERVIRTKEEVPFLIRVFKFIFLFRPFLIINKGREKIFLGELLFSGNQHDTFLIFDFNHNIVAKWFEDTRKLLEEEKKKIYFQSFGFHVLPNIQLVYKNKTLNQHLRFERLITCESIPIENFFNSIINDIYRYQADLRCNKRSMKYSEKVINDWYKKNGLILSIDTTVINLLPITKIYSLGDLHPDNILKDKSSYYYIDFEASDYLPFYYDIFTFMHIAERDKNNPSLLNNYFMGKYDHFLSCLFKINNLQFSSLQKELYYCLFLYDYYNHVRSYGHLLLPISKRLVIERNLAYEIV